VSPIWQFPRLFSWCPSFTSEFCVLSSKTLVCFLGFNFFLQMSDTWNVFSIPLRHLSFFLDFNILTKCRTLGNFCFPVLDTYSFFLVSIFYTEFIFLSSTLVCFLGFNFLLQVSGTWNFFSPSRSDTCLFFRSQYFVPVYLAIFSVLFRHLAFFLDFNILTKCRTLDDFRDMNFNLNCIYYIYIHMYIYGYIYVYCLTL